MGQLTTSLFTCTQCHIGIKPNVGYNLTITHINIKPNVGYNSINNYINE